jgi:MoxR-like ATPase
METFVDRPAAADPSRELPHVRLQQVRLELHRVIVGQERMLDRLLTSVLADGHCLLEGVPGLGKTLTLSTLAQVIGGTFSRIQFTADLIPSDIVGTRVYRQTREEFDIEPGPILANIVLADEINRAPAKVQSALLEVMQERQVTIGGRTMPAPRPFLVVATQNPIESEGVYPLPEAQRDRFLMRIPVDYPTPAEERFIVERFEAGSPPVARLLDAEDVVALQHAARAVHLDGSTRDYAVRLVLATREPATHGLAKLAGLLEYGASPRASLGLVRAAKALALLRGRDIATPQEVYDVAYDVLNLRLVLTYRALADGLTIDDVLVELLSSVRAPAAPAAWGRAVPPTAQALVPPAMPVPQPMGAAAVAPMAAVAPTAAQPTAQSRIPAPHPAAPVDGGVQPVVPATTSGTTGGDVPFAIGSATPTSGPMATPPTLISVAGAPTPEGAVPAHQAPAPAPAAPPAPAPAEALAPNLSAHQPPASAPPQPATLPAQPPMYVPPAG